MDCMEYFVDVPNPHGACVDTHLWLTLGVQIAPMVSSQCHPYHIELESP